MRHLKFTPPTALTLATWFLMSSCATPAQCPVPQDASAQAADEPAAPTPAEPTPEPARVWLASWKAGPSKQAIQKFVQEVTDPKNANFVPEPQRIATFDNDGTLWVENPMYSQFLFALDRLKEQSAEHPEWKKQQPFKAVLENDTAAMSKFHTKDLLAVMMATHADTTSDELSVTVKKWLKTAKHPTFNRPYTELVYQPMLELLDYLRASGFKTFIVSGGGVDFIRVFAEEVYGIPPEQVIGSALASEYQANAAEPPVVRHKSEIFNLNDGPGKPISIDRIIGRRPLIAVGNSDGDYEMLDWSTSGTGPRLGIYVHHTDAEREAAYDREGKVGKLSRGLDDAKGKGWLVVDMKEDWLKMFP